MQRVELIVLISLVTSFQSCNSQPNSQVISDANVVKEIPVYKNGDTTVLYQFDKQLAHQLNLDSLELGYDSLQLRIWFNYGTHKTHHLLVMKRMPRKWTAKFYTLTVEWNDDNTHLILKNKRSRNVTPSSGWEQFASKFFALNLFSLPHIYDIPGYGGGGDRPITSVEFATKDKYRYFYYINPKQYQDKFPQAKNMENILQLLEEEFDFRRLE